MNADEEELTTEAWIFSLPPDGDKGYFLEVDLHYPEEIHANRSDCPLVPEKFCVKGTQPSPYQRKILYDQIKEEDANLTKAQVNAKIDAYESLEKLIPNLCDKTKYILHYRNLQLYLILGLKIKKIHRVLRFTQEQWLKSYIEHNTKMR